LANSNAEAMLQAFLESEKASRLAQERREKRDQERFAALQAKRKARDERNDKMMESFFTILGTALSAYVNNNNQGRGVTVWPPQGVNDHESDSDSSYNNYRAQCGLTQQKKHRKTTES
jgi:hypothetical protein